MRSQLLTSWVVIVFVFIYWNILVQIGSNFTTEKRNQLFRVPEFLGIEATEALRKAWHEYRILGGVFNAVMTQDTWAKEEENIIILKLINPDVMTLNVFLRNDHWRWLHVADRENARRVGGVRRAMNFRISLQARKILISWLTISFWRIALLQLIS